MATIQAYHVHRRACRLQEVYRISVAGVTNTHVVYEDGSRAPIRDNNRVVVTSLPAAAARLEANIASKQSALQDQIDGLKDEIVNLERVLSDNSEILGLVNTSAESVSAKSSSLLTRFLRSIKTKKGN